MTNAPVDADVVDLQIVGAIGDRQDLLPQGFGSMWRTSLLSGSEKRRLARLMALLPRLKTGDLNGVSVDDWIADLVGGGDLAHSRSGARRSCHRRRCGAGEGDPDRRRCPLERWRRTRQSS